MITWLCTFAATAAPPPAAPPVASQMHQRFFTLTAARDAVIQGQLLQARRAVEPLTRADPSEAFPDAWRPMVRKVEAAAASLAQAKDLAQASERVAKVAGACAECHATTGGGPAITEAEQVPSQAWSDGQNMPLHKWSVDWMWVGLLANDNEAWVRGSKELDERPLAPKYAPETLLPNGMKELEQLVYAVAGKALSVDNPGERTVLYGNLLATCAQCHVLRNAAGGSP